MTLRRWTILSVILLVPGFVLQFLSRTVFVPEAGVIGGLPFLDNRKQVVAVDG